MEEGWGPGERAALSPCRNENGRGSWGKGDRERRTELLLPHVAWDRFLVLADGSRGGVGGGRSEERLEAKRGGSSEKYRRKRGLGFRRWEKKIQGREEKNKRE